MDEMNEVRLGLHSTVSLPILIDFYEVMIGTLSDDMSSVTYLCIVYKETYHLHGLLRLWMRGAMVAQRLYARIKLHGGCNELFGI